MSNPDLVRENQTVVKYHENGDIDEAVSIEPGVGHLKRPCLVEVRRKFHYDTRGNVSHVSVTREPYTPPLSQDTLVRLQVMADIAAEREKSYARR